MPFTLAFPRPVLLVTAAALVGTAGAGILLFVREREQAKSAAANRAQLMNELAQTRSQMRDIAARLDTLSTAITTPPERRAPVAARPAAPPQSPTPRSQLEDRRLLQQLQSQVSLQQRQLAQAREDFAKASQNLQGELNTTRDDLKGELHSTKSELNESIAKNHEELVLLQKRGERNYYEFELIKSKELRRIGPVGLALRKTNTKHQNYNMDIMVEDFRLEKKNVNLYEPMWIYVTDRPQPMEVVINFIGKDQVRGYVSEPKYKKAELSKEAVAPLSVPPQLKAR